MASFTQSLSETTGVSDIEDNSVTILNSELIATMENTAPTLGLVAGVIIGTDDVISERKSKVRGFANTIAGLL